jgi:hypothetical protein
MGSEPRHLPLLAASLVLAGCASQPRFPLREPITHDDDERPFAEAPPTYVSPFAWDGANQLVFRPVSRFFAVDPAGPAVDVNALDEVPDSSWFANRLGAHPMTPEEIAKGPCADGKTLDTNGPDGSWIIDQGKSNGANPGFRVNVPGYGKFLLKTDPVLEPERETGATSVAARLYHAAGFYSPCDSVVYIRRSILTLKPGLTVTDNSGVTRPFDEKALDKVLASASHRGDLVRMVASRWLPGQTIGPYQYQGTRSDDPNDVIPHEDRRELRGARLLAAWTNHFDTREQNTMNVFLRKDGAKTGPGFVRHYILDLGDAFGSIWDWDSITRRIGFAYYFDFTYLAEDFVTLGTQIRPWEVAKKDGGTFSYYSSRNFDPEAWKGGYPNPAFLRMTEGDAAWMARIIARFTDEDIAAVVRVGDFTRPESTKYLTEALIERRDAILRRYLTRLSPLADVHVTGDGRLCATDLAKRTHAANLDLFHYSARRYAGWPPGAGEKVTVEVRDHDEVCLPLLSHETGASAPDDDVSRYVIVDVSNSVVPGVLRVHLYDLGADRGMRLVGIERPVGDDPP